MLMVGIVTSETIYLHRPIMSLLKESAESDNGHVNMTGALERDFEAASDFINRIRPHINMKM